MRGNKCGLLLYFSFLILMNRLTSFTPILLVRESSSGDKFYRENKGREIVTEKIETIEYVNLDCNHDPLFIL